MFLDVLVCACRRFLSLSFLIQVYHFCLLIFCKRVKVDAPPLLLLLLLWNIWPLCLVCCVFQWTPNGQCCGAFNMLASFSERRFSEESERMEAKERRCYSKLVTGVAEKKGVQSKRAEASDGGDSTRRWWPWRQSALQHHWQRCRARQIVLLFFLFHPLSLSLMSPTMSPWNFHHTHHSAILAKLSFSDFFFPLFLSLKVLLWLLNFVVLLLATVNIFFTSWKLLKKPPREINWQ